MRAITKRGFLKKLGLVGAASATLAAQKGVTPRKLRYADVRAALTKAGCHLG